MLLFIVKIRVRRGKITIIIKWYNNKKKAFYTL